MRNLLDAPMTHIMQSGLKYSKAYLKLVILFVFFWVLFFDLKGQELSGCNVDSIKNVLIRILDADQEIRRILIDSIGINSPDAAGYFAKMEENDAKNRVQVKKIISTCGWLGCSLIGDRASDALFFVVQHSDLATMEKYYPKLKEMADKGEAKKKHEAMMLDRILMNKGLRQRYGTQVFRNSETKNVFIIWPVENPKIINSLRKRMGLEDTIEEYANEMNAVYRPDQIIPKRN